MYGEKAERLRALIDKKLSDSRAEVEKKFLAIHNEFNGKIQGLATKYKKEAQALSTKYTDEIQELKTKHGDKTQALSTQYERMVQALQAERKAAEKAYEIEHEQAKKSLEVEFEKVIQVHEKNLQLINLQKEEELRELQIQDEVMSEGLNEAGMGESAQLLETVRPLIKQRERLDEHERVDEDVCMVDATESPAEEVSEKSVPSETHSTFNIDSGGITTRQATVVGAQHISESTKTEDKLSRVKSKVETHASTAETKVGDSRKESTPSPSSRFKRGMCLPVGTYNTTVNGRPLFRSSRDGASQGRLDVPESSEATGSASAHNRGRSFIPRAPPKRLRAGSDAISLRKIARPSGELEYSLELMTALATPANKIFTFNNERTEFVEPDLVRGVPISRLQEDDRRYWLPSWVTLSEAFEKINLGIQKGENAEKYSEKYKDPENQKEDCIFFDRSKISFVKSMVGPDSRFHPNQLLTKTSLTEGGLCNSHEIHDISRYLLALRCLKENGMLEMEPEEFLRWRINLVCEKLKTDISLPAKTILKYLDAKNKQMKYCDPAMGFAMALAKDKQKMRGFLRTFLIHKACGWGTTNDLD